MRDRAQKRPLHSARILGRTLARRGILLVAAVAAGLAFAFLQPSVARADDAPPAAQPGLPDAFPTVPAAPSAEPPAAPTSDVPPAPAPSDPPPVPASPPDLGEAIATTVQEAAGNVDVSVRVLSPGSDGPVTQNPASSKVIPDAEQGDITASPQTDATPASAPDPSASEAGESSRSTSDGGGNTNVTVRVLSPGDDGPVTQTNDGTSDSVVPSPPAAPDDTTPGGAAASTEPSLEPARAASDGSSEPALSEDNSERYQGEDSQYQSDETEGEEPWDWAWQLVIDCAGDVTSISNESGSSSSADWTWEWMWDWSCDQEPDATDSSGFDGTDGPSTTPRSSGPTSSDTRATNANVSVRVLSPGDDGPVAQTGGASTSDGAGSSEPSTSQWSWGWTFTFCGRTITVSTDIAVHGDLNWLWSWVWDWPCDSAVGPPPDMGGAPDSDAGTPQPAPVDNGATTLEAAAAIPPAPGAMSVTEAPDTTSMSASEAPDTTSNPTSPWPTFSTPAFTPDITVAVNLPAALTGPAQTSPPMFAGFDVAGAAISIVAGATGSISSAATAVDGATPAAVAPAALPARGLPPATGSGSPTPPLPSTARTAHTLPFVPRTQASDAQKPAEKPVSVRPAPRRGDRGSGRFPLGELQSGQTSGAGAVGGRVPSTQVVSSAAILAFFRLAAPGLGRRIRVARGLSPRSAFPTSIEHPG